MLVTLTGLGEAGHVFSGDAGYAASAQAQRMLQTSELQFIEMNTYLSVPSIVPALMTV